MEVWKRIQIGGKRSSELLTKMVTDQIKIGTWVSVAIKALPNVVSPKRTVDFVRCEVRDLGFSAEPTQTELWEAVSEIEPLCSRDAGMYLRLQFMEQETGECLFVISQPIEWPPGGKSIFRLSCSNGDLHRQLRFQICPVDEKAHWPLKQKIAFTLKMLGE